MGMFMYVTCYEGVYVCLCMYDRPIRNFFLSNDYDDDGADDIVMMMMIY